MQAISLDIVQQAANVAALQATVQQCINDRTVPFEGDEFVEGDVQLAQAALAEFMATHNMGELEQRLMEQDSFARDYFIAVFDHIECIREEEYDGRYEDPEDFV